MVAKLDQTILNTFKMLIILCPHYLAMRPPQFQDWPEKTISWFKENISHKALFAVIFSQDGRPAGSKHTGISKSSIVPATLAVRLIDTGGEEDVIVDELMAEMGLAVNDPSQEEV